jgi:hypothetical protein
LIFTFSISDGFNLIFRKFLNVFIFVIICSNITCNHTAVRFRPNFQFCCFVATIITSDKSIVFCVRINSLLLDFKTSSILYLTLQNRHMKVNISFVFRIVNFQWKFSVFVRNSSNVFILIPIFTNCNLPSLLFYFSINYYFDKKCIVKKRSNVIKIYSHNFGVSLYTTKYITSNITTLNNIL